RANDAVPYRIDSRAVRSRDVDALVVGARALAVDQPAHRGRAAEDRAGIGEAAANRMLLVEGLDRPAVRRGPCGLCRCGWSGGGGGLDRKRRPPREGATADRCGEEEHRGGAAPGAALEMRVGSHAATVESGRNGSLSRG